jgi:NAD(P) transhydrogenase subunit beta
MTIVVDLCYLVSISLFILGLRLLSSPRTARRGNLLSMLGMFIAVVITLLDKQIIDYKYIIAGIIIGGLIGAYSALKVKMTAMPQMVALFNAFGGGASALVALSQFLRKSIQSDVVTTITIALSVFIGMLTFTGSVVAFAKLQELIKGRPILFPGQKALNFLLVAAILALGAFFVGAPSFNSLTLLIIIFILSSIVGVALVIPVGGADMPVVIALLNSYSGLAAATTGFVINNYVLIVSGALVGASGIILTNLMCKAMNRSLGNVLFGGVGGEVLTGGPRKRERPLRHAHLERG